MGHDQARFEVEGKDSHGKLFKREVQTAEIRLGLADTPREANAFDERSRRNIVEVTNHLGGTVRRIKRID